MHKFWTALWGGAALALVVVWGATALAETKRVVVVGEGQVAVVPDMASMRLGVEVQGATAATALALASGEMSDLIDGLSAAGIAAQDMQTSRVSVEPVFEQRDLRDTPPGVIGYAARSDLTVRLRDLDAIGMLLDAAAVAGGNRFFGLSFDVQDRAPHVAAARRAAVADAIAKAALYTDAAGVNLGDLLEISETGTAAGGPPMMESASARSMPIAAGEIEIGARVTMVFALGD